MKYKLTLDNDNYLLSYVHTNTDMDVYEFNPATLTTNLNYYKFINGRLVLDSAKKERAEKEAEEKEKHANDISEQTLKLAEMFINMGVNANEFMDRLDAQALYTALMTDTLIESEANDNE